jgi:hypothetical protein
MPAHAFDDFGIGCADDDSASISFSNDSSWNLTVTAGPDSGNSLKTAVKQGRNMWVGSEIEHWQGGAALSGGSPTMTMNIRSWVTGGAAVTDCVTDNITFDYDKRADFLDRLHRDVWSRGA